MKRDLSCYLAIIIILFLTACASSQAPQDPVSQLKVVTLNNTVKIVTGQTVYVPVYSHIYGVDRNQTVDLAATLSVRNTDLTNPIIITLVNYYNTNGELVRKYLKQPVELRALATIDFVVNREDTSGGAGANFIVEWVAQKKVSEPVIEAVMINTVGNQALSWVSNGRVIKSRGVQNK
jgi:ABC-type Fe3+-hydroxamate transport system substrate-binding protein